MSKYGNALGPAQATFHPILKRVAAGYVDEKLLTVRKMAAAGATADEIGQATGMSGPGARAFILRNNLVWNRARVPNVNRHVVASAGAIGGHMRMGHAKWAEEGVRLYQQGTRTDEIAERLGVRESAVITYFYRHGIKPLKPIPRKKRPSETGMLALILRLHVEGTLSEGQVATATGLDRAAIRRLIEKSALQVAA